MVRSTPQERFELRLWLKCMAVWCIVWSVAILVIARPDSPAWQYLAGFAIFYAVGWISPPVWLVAYITERVITSQRNKRQTA